MPSLNVLRNVNLSVSNEGNGRQRGGPNYANINWRFREAQASGSAPIDGRLIIDLRNGVSVDATTTSAGTLPVLPSYLVTSSVQSTSAWPYLGSYSMSLSISGSDYQYAASSSNSSSILMNEFTASQGVNYTISSSIGYVDGCSTPWLTLTASCGTNVLGYSVASLDTTNNKWYPTSPDGTYSASVNTAGTITGSATVINVNQNGCNYPGVQFSGSATFPLSSLGVYLAIYTGSFTITGDAGGGYNWSISSYYIQSGSTNLSFAGGGATSFTYDNETNKNALVGFGLGTFVSPFNRREVTYYVSGSAIANNPPFTSFGFPLDLGSTFTLSGVGVINSFGEGTGSAAQQTQYNCLYGSTPSK